MAEIFLAKFQGIGGFEKKIIIKRILPRFSENREFIDMLIKEAKTAVLLHHQNVVQIYDLGKVRDTYFISMEYIRGKDLRTVLNRLKSQGQFMPRELAVFICREICKGLDYAHNITDTNGEPLHLVHRDISPPNVLLSLEGEVKIIDFGIAKATSQATDTQAGVFKGKFAYMAPEQASGIPVDRRADIFATGLILWEMLTTKKLLEAESDIATLERAKRVDAYDIPFRDYDIPEQLEKIIRRALRQDRSERYQTAGEMSRDLTVYLNLNYPGFSETDLADFLRQLFNLDKRRGSSGGEVITAAPGDRSNTNSEFFKPLAGAPTENTDPSIKLAQAAHRAATEGKREGATASDQWDLLEEFKAIAQGGEDAPAQGKNEWVSQVAQDMVPQEDGTIITYPTGVQPTPGAATTGHTMPVAPSPPPTPQVSHTPGGPTASQPSAPQPPATPQGSGSKIAIAALLAAVLLLGSAVIFPDKMAQLKESLGLVQKATVALAYEPPDAELVLNGNVVAEASSPYTMTLPIGSRYTVLVRKQGYLPQQQEIDLVAARTHKNLNIRLLPELATGNGKLELLKLPPGSRVFINDAPVNASTLSTLPTDVSLTVKVVKDHFVPFEQTLPPLGEQPVQLEVAMKPAPVSISIKSEPAGAIVMIDKRQVGASPYAAETFQPGQEYQIDLAAPGYKPYSTKVTPEVGRPVDLRIPLEPVGGVRPGTPGKGTGTGPTGSTAVPTGTLPTAAGATTPAPVAAQEPPPVEVRPVRQTNNNQVKVQILAVPWAEVYVDNKYMGRTPVEMVLKPGKHKLRLVNKDKEVDYSEDRDFRPSDDGSIQTLNFEM